MAADRSEKARCHKSDAHVAGESHSPIVPEKPANNGGVPPPAESAEGGAVGSFGAITQHLFGKCIEMTL